MIRRLFVKLIALSIGYAIANVAMMAIVSYQYQTTEYPAKVSAPLLGTEVLDDHSEDCGTPSADAVYPTGAIVLFVMNREMVYTENSAIVDEAFQEALGGESSDRIDVIEFCYS